MSNVADNFLRVIIIIIIVNVKWLRTRLHMSMYGREGSKGEGKRRVRVWKEIEGGEGERESRKRQKEDRWKVGREGGRQHVLLNSP